MSPPTQICSASGGAKAGSQDAWQGGTSPGRSGSGTFSTSGRKGGGQVAGFQVAAGFHHLRPAAVSRGRAETRPSVMQLKHCLRGNGSCRPTWLVGNSTAAPAACSEVGESMSNIRVASVMRPCRRSDARFGHDGSVFRHHRPWERRISAFAKPLDLGTDDRGVYRNKVWDF